MAGRGPSSSVAGVTDLASAPLRTAFVRRVGILGPALAIGAGVVWSLGALAARLADQADAWQYLIWRSIGIIVVIEALGATRRTGSRLVLAYRSGWLMLAACAALLLASVAFVYAIKNTSAANASFLASVTPLIAVVLARVFLKERLTRITLLAIAAALVGLLIMVVGDLDGGNVVGNVAALFSALGFAAYTVCIRSGPSIDWSPVLPGYAAMMIALCAAVTFATGNTLVPPIADVGYALLHGGVLIVVGTVWYNTASRTVPAVPMTIFALSEMVFVPVWIFLWFAERPRPATLVGGAIVLAAVVAKAVLEPPNPGADHAEGHIPEPGPGSIA